MQIQLKQTEIIAALKQYITAQGINLAGKDVSISFTAGRKESGITADLVIEDAGIPGFDDEAEDTTKTTLTVVSSNPPELKAAAEEPSAEPAVNETKTTSLFN
jgi:hypothetical protein